MKKVRRTKRRNTRPQKRNYDDERYKKARAITRKRDNYRCQWPGCKCKTKLKVHHIKRWAKSPLLRYNTKNLITLCKYHHNLIYGKEEQYEYLFMKIVSEKEK